MASEMTKHPQKKNQTSFAVASGEEPKGRMIGFRPLISLEAEIDAAVERSGKTLASWLRDAVEAYLKQNPAEAGEELNGKGELNCDGRTGNGGPEEEPTTPQRNEAPTRRGATLEKEQAADVQPSSKSQRRPAARAKAAKAARNRSTGV